jgi:hypothetical protein
MTDASKEVRLEINVEKTKYMSLSCHHDARKYHDIKQQRDSLKLWNSSNI